jgi:hemerythrin
MNIPWSDAYAIGDTVIDSQHEVWFQRINSFLEATDKESLTHCETLMYQYTRIHFRYEETLMRSVSYPDLRLHIHQHNELLDNLNSIADHIAHGKLDPLEWHLFLSDWLLGHIRAHDTKLAAYVRKKEHPAG